MCCTARLRPLLPIAAATALLLAPPASLDAAVERVEVLQREPFAAEAAFGSTGSYEKIRGRLHYAIDPGDPANRRIVDLALAPHDGRGLVTFAGDFILLRPVDPSRGNRRLLYEVNNRGNLAMLAFFNEGARTNDPALFADAGTGFLLRQGYTLLWSAWNWDVLPGDGRMQIELPVATDDGAPITGPVAAEFAVDRPTQSAPYMWGNSRGYPPAASAESDARLTVRDEPDGPRVEIPRDAWRFEPAGPGAVPEHPTHVHYSEGFVPGRIYELVYTARDPRVVGLGLAAIRDALAFFRFERTDWSGAVNPLLAANGEPDPEAAIIFGISQSGRVIQHMLYEALHVDEAGRPVFDAALIHVAGAGKGSFNHRFAQTTRHPSHLEDHQYPADFFPFTTTPQRDPLTGETGDVLARARAADAVPYIFYTGTSTEYWTRAASLLHTDVTGKADVPADPRARVYVIAGAQHGVWRSPWRGAYETCGNPLDHRPPMRALLLALDAWATRGEAPPASVHPRLIDGTLVAVEAYRGAFPAIPDLRLPEGNLQPPRLDLGPRFRERGIADRQPPAFGPAYITRVPYPDRDGNDLGGVRLPEIAVPLGTYTGWNLRRPEVGAPDKLARWSGSFVPFAPTEAARAAAGDPRPSLAARYTSRANHEAKVEAAAKGLVTAGFLLAAEVPGIVARAGRLYGQVVAHPPGSASCPYLLDE